MPHLRMQEELEIYMKKQKKHKQNGFILRRMMKKI